MRFVQAQGDITSVTYSADGRLLMTTETGAVTLREAATGQVIRQWLGGGERAWLSDDGKQILDPSPAPGSPPRCILRNVGTGQVLRQWAGQVMDVLPDLSLMAIDDDHRVLLGMYGPPGRAPTTGRVVEVATGRVVGQFPLDGSWEVRLSRDGHYLCLPQFDHPSRLLRLPDMTSMLSLPPLSWMWVSRDDARLVGVSPEGTLHIWLLPSGRHIAIPTGLVRARWVFGLGSDALAVSGVAGAGNDFREVVQVRSGDGTRLLRSLPGDPQGYSADDRYIAFRGAGQAGGSDAYDVMDALTGRRVARLDATMNPLGQPLLHSDIETDGLAIAPDGIHFAYAAGGGLLRLYDLTRPDPPPPGAPISTDGGHGVLSLRGRPDASLSGAVALPSGGVAAAAAPDTGSGPPRTVLPAAEEVGGGMYHLAEVGTSPDGSTLVVLWDEVTRRTRSGRSVPDYMGDGMMELRDAKTGRLLRTLLSTGPGDFDPFYHRGALGQPVFSQDGRIVAVADETGRVLLWDTRTGRRAGQMSGARAAGVSTVEAFAEGTFRIAPLLAFSSDGRFLATGRDDGSIYLYSLRTMLLVAQVGQVKTQPGVGSGQMPEPLRWMAFDANGRTLYGVAQDGTDVLAWDVPTVSP